MAELEGLALQHPDASAVNKFMHNEVSVFPRWIMSVSVVSV